MSSFTESGGAALHEAQYENIRQSLGSLCRRFLRVLIILLWFLHYCGLSNRLILTWLPSWQLQKL